MQQNIFPSIIGSLAWRENEQLIFKSLLSKPPLTSLEQLKILPLIRSIFNQSLFIFQNLQFKIINCLKTI